MPQHLFDEPNYSNSLAGQGQGSLANLSQIGAAAVEPSRAEKLAKLFQMYLAADKDYVAATEYLAKLALEEQSATKQRADARARAVKAKEELSKLMLSGDEGQGEARNLLMGAATGGGQPPQGWQGLTQR
jgi:hypothetical protein